MENYAETQVVLQLPASGSVAGVLARVENHKKISNPTITPRRQPLRVLNVNGLRRHYHAVLQIADHHQADVLLLSELGATTRNAQQASFANAHADVLSLEDIGGKDLDASQKRRAPRVGHSQ